MDNSDIRFRLTVYGAQSWSYAVIQENTPETSTGVDENPWNENSREILEK